MGRKAPASVESFLNDSAEPHEVDSQSHQPANPQSHNSTNVGADPISHLGRLHIEIRLDLVQQLMQCFGANENGPTYAPQKYPTSNPVI